MSQRNPTTCHPEPPHSHHTVTPLRLSPPQRLHPNHEQPKNASTRYDSGWLLFFRPATTANSPAAAREAFNKFIDCCNRPLDYLAVLNAAAASSPIRAQPEQRPQPMHPLQRPQPMYPPVPSTWSGALSQPTTRPPVAAAAVPMAPPTAPSGVAQYPTIALHQPTSDVQEAAGGLVQLQPADAPPSGPLGAVTGSSSSQRVWHDAERAQAAGGTSGSGSEQEYDPLVARPGESDAAFAQRLSRMYGSFSQAAQDGDGAPATGAAGVTGTSSHSPQRPAAVQPPHQGPGAGGGQDVVPSAPPALNPNPFDGGAPPLHQMATGDLAALLTAAAAAAGPTVGANSEDEENMCIVCLTNQRQIGFLHGSSVHRCVCKECACDFSIGGPCPLCRAPITAILNVY